MIEARGIGKHFSRRTVLQDLDLKVSDGELVALLGSNGAGKTTLLRILGTLLSPSAGDVLIDDVSVFEDVALARRSIGMVGHSTYTYDDLTALENLRFYWLMNSMQRSSFDAIGKELLRRVGLSHRMNDRAAIFSRGMRQRLAIARSLIHSPKVLLYDEPFASLDQRGIDIVSQILTEERKKKRAIVVVTHDLASVSALADRALVLSKRRIAGSFDRHQIADGSLKSAYSEIVAEGQS